MYTDIKTNGTYACKGRTVEVDCFLKSTVVSVRDVASGEMFEVATSELGPVHKDRPKSVDVSAIPADVWHAAKSQYELLEGTLNLERLDRVTVGRLATQMGCSVRRVQRLRKKLRAACRISTLVDRKCGRKLGSRGLAQQTEEIMSRMIRKHYLTRERPTVMAVLERVRAMCYRAKIPAPSYQTLQRRIMAWDEYEVVKAREGAKAARQKFAGRPGRLEVERPLDLIEIDHTLVDVIVVSDDEHRIPIERPWITLAIDVYSRAVLGFYLSLHHPNSTSVGLCIAHALLPKNDWMAERGLAHYWPMFGSPKTILTDNATEFSGTSMANGCDELRITLMHRPVGRPQWGGHIERLIGTMMGRVHFISGTTFSNSHQRGKDYDSAAKACMTLEELQAWVTNEICNRYHISKHRGIGMAPLDAWEQAAMTFNTSKEVH